MYITTSSVSTLVYVLVFNLEYNLKISHLIILLSHYKLLPPLPRGCR